MEGKSKKIKILAIITLIVALIVPAVALAIPDGDGVVDSKGKWEQNPRHKGRDNAVERYEKLHDLVKTYAPEDVGKWEAQFEEFKAVRNEFMKLKDQVRDNRTEGRKEWRQEHKEEIKAYMKGLRAKVEAGEMTKEEARVELKNYKEALIDERKDDREEFKENLKERREKFKEKLEARKEKREALMDTLKIAVEKEDTEAIKEALDEIYDYHQEGIVRLKERLALIQEKLEVE